MVSEQSTSGKQAAAVIIEVEAYVKALMHVLRFASNAIKNDSWCEVYGWLVGKIETEGDKEIVHVHDAVPIHHGKDIEVVWDAEAYVRAAEFDEQLFERSLEDSTMKGMFVVGWYHSHPGLDFFLSSVDVGNHLGFQGPNPLSIAIVFDHTKIVPYKHLGFKIYRLDEPSPQSDFHEVPFDRKPFSKEMLDVVYVLQEVLERIQANQLVTPEIGEIPTVFSHLMLPGATPSIDKTPPIDLNVLFEKVFKSTQGLIQKMFGESMVSQLATKVNPALEEWFSAFLPYLASSLNKWMLSLAEKLVITNKLSLGSVHTIAGTLERSTKSINDWLKLQLLDQRKAIVKLLKENQDATATEVGRVLDATAGGIGTLQESVNVASTRTADQVTELARAVGKLNERLDAFEKEIRGSIDAISGRATAVEAVVSSMEERLAAAINQGLATVNERVDATVRGLDASLKEQVATNGKGMESHLIATRDAITKELAAIAEKLAKERREMDELVASKQIKGMQQDIKSMQEGIKKLAGK